MGLVDSLGYRRDAVALAGSLAGLGTRPRVVRLSETEPSKPEWTVPRRIAIVYAAGAIDIGASGNDIFLGPTMGSETMTRQIEAAFKERDVQAVVFRVESPGGVSLASDRIHETLERMKAETKKPLIVSMGRSAGSGGYQISTPGDRIYADRFTSTGSIGVVFVRPSLEGFYKKHDVHEDDFVRGAAMRGWSIGHDWDAEMQALADTATMRDYRDFVSLVADDRKLPWDEVESMAQGRVWTGDDAVRLKLVDQIGGLDAAVAEARRRAGVPVGEKIAPVEYRRPQGNWFQRAAGTFVRESLERTLRMPTPGQTMKLDDGADPNE
jgi:protease-4